MQEAYVDEYGRQLAHVIVKARQPKLKEPDGKILPKQGSDQYLRFEGAPDRTLGENYSDAELGKKNFLYAFLSLPFDQQNAEFYEYADFLRANSPCPMSKSTWKTWSLTKSGSGYVGRKLKLDSAAANFQ